jgi:hypothetical protein
MTDSLGAEREQKYKVRYQYGTYSGERIVWAEDSEQAVAKVKRELRPHMTLPMAHEAYHVEEV